MPVILHESMWRQTLDKMCPDWRGKLSTPLQQLYFWRGWRVHHMGQGWSIGLRPAPRLLPLLFCKERSRGLQSLWRRIQSPPFPLQGRLERGRGGLVDNGREHGVHHVDYHIQRARDQVIMEWGQKEAFFHTYRFEEKTPMSVSWICFHCHGKSSEGPSDNSTP